MAISNEEDKKQKPDKQWLKLISAKWMIALVCLGMICVAGVVAHYRQTMSAGSTAENAEVNELLPGKSIGGGADQDIEKTARSTDKLANKPSIWPTGGEVTSGFGWRNSPWGEGREMHPGIDIANSMDTPIVATADGEVVQTGPAGGYGNIVQIDHGNGIITIYGHNSRIAVEAGQSVRKGQVISYMGSTGKSTGPHVHYEVRVNGTAVNPIGYLVLY